MYNYFHRLLWPSTMMLPLLLLILRTVSVRALDCNFDSGGLCQGVSQSRNDKFDWTVRKGSTPSSGTGPSGDINGNGYYAYIEASSPRRPGDNALLDFDSDLSSGSTCISFSYHMNGRDVGELRVLVNGNVEFSSKGSKGGKWIKKMMTIAGVAAKKVTFEGIRGPGWQGDIAIDEVSIKGCGGGGGEGGAGGNGGGGGCGTPPLPNTPPPPPTGAPPTRGCGIRPSSRIVGGTDAKPGDWPWQAMLRTGSGFPYCGGTLVTPVWVVTAAHCIATQTASSVFVRLGAYRRRENVGTEQDFSVIKIIKHPSYNNPKRYSHDIALLKLDKPAALDRNVALACLPQNVAAPGDNTKCWITGWGRLSSGGGTPDKLQQASVPIAGRDRCDKAYPRRIHDSMICAGLDQGGIDSCQGDSGGPMVCENGGRYYLQGVTSWGYGCASPGKFGVYAKVKFLLSWINDEMKNN